jgi:hypothetical protein
MLIFIMTSMLILAPIGAVGGLTGQSIEDQEYDDDLFVTSQKEFRHGEVLIKIFQAKKKKNREVPPHECRAWIAIEKSGKLVKRFYYEDISPVGDRYGIFLPRKQPYKDFFTIIKLGDYDGRLIVVDKKGGVVDTPGGRFFTTSDKRYLFSEYVSDIGGISVLDMKTGKAVFTSTRTPFVDNWYHYRGSVAFTEYDSANKRKEPAVNPSKGRIFHIYDFKEHRFDRVRIYTSSDDLEKIEYDFGDPRGCDCGSCK